MKTAKQELIEMLQRLPDDVSIETLIYEVEFVAGILQGLADAERGDTVSQAEVEEQLSQWRASSGRVRRSVP